MATLNETVRRLRVLQDEATDAELLRRFTDHDASAFTALVRRHGPLVFGVCKRVLKNTPDAEDAFQATFLVLARKAASIRKPSALASWLYGVAQRTALQAKRAATKRRAKEAIVPPRTETKTDHDELLAVLDQEISCLPEKYREVIVLCDLQGKTRKEAARKLNCQEGTVASRLARAREMLARRLTRKGFGVSVVALAAICSREASASLPASLLVRTADLSSVPTTVTAIAERVVKAMLLTRLKVVGAVVLLMGFLAAATIGEAPADESPVAKAHEPKATDAEFIRRVSLETRGTLPSDVEVHYFLQDKNSKKRAWLVEMFKQEALQGRRGDTSRLQGTWEVAAVTQNGQKVGTQLLKLVFKGDRVTSYSEGKVERVASYKLEAEKSPPVIRATFVNEFGREIQENCVYELKGDRLKLCMNRQSDGPLPSDFRPSESTVVMELRRTKEQQEGHLLKDFRPPAAGAAP